MLDYARPGRAGGPRWPDYLAATALAGIAFTLALFLGGALVILFTGGIAPRIVWLFPFGLAAAVAAWLFRLHVKQCGARKDRTP